MDDQRLGSLFRAVPPSASPAAAGRRACRRGDRMWISRVERGHLAAISIARLRAIAQVLEVRLDVVPLWRGGEVARVVNERHSRMHELFSAHLARTPGWEFATGGDVLALRRARGDRHPRLARRAARGPGDRAEVRDPDPAGLIAQVDRYRRLAPEIARERGWDPAEVAAWVLVAESDMEFDGSSRDTGSCSATRSRSTAARSGAGFATRCVRARGAVNGAGFPRQRGPLDH